MSLIDRSYALRNRLLGSPVFQRFSSSFPLTRPIADRQARALFDLCAGFVYSQILAACVRLELFKLLASGPMTAAELSHAMSVPLASTQRLLEAAVSLRLVSQRSGGRFGLGMLGAALNGNPGITAMIEHHALLYRDLADPVALLRGENRNTDLAQYWSYATAQSPDTLPEESVADYSGLMAVSQSFIAGDVLDAYPFDRHQCLLDVGGGEGAFVVAAAQRFARLRFMLFDLPAVARRAQGAFTSSGIADRASAQGGSFLSDQLPQGADIVSLVRIVHDHDDAAVAHLLQAVGETLPPGGTILIAEPMAGVSGAEPVGAAYFGMYLLAMGSGRPRTPDELAQLLENAGFVRIRQRRTRRPMLVGLITAQRP